MLGPEARKAIVAFTLLLAAVIVLNVFTARLHPDPQSIPSRTLAEPQPRWQNAVTRQRQSIRQALYYHNLPGLSLAVGVGGDIVWAEGFGYADLTTGTPVTPRHRFRIGSASTVLTSAAAGLLLADGRWKLDDEIQSHLPGFPRKQAPITLRALMSHTSGLRSDGGDEGPLFTRHCASPAEALPTFASQPLLFEPGTQFRPSLYAWILLSAALESTAGQPFLAFMQDRVFLPLALEHTVADRVPAADDDFPLFNLFREVVYDPRTRLGARTGHRAEVTSYFPKLAANPRYGLHLMRPLDYSCYAGAAAFRTTPSDLVRFGMAIQAGKLLPPALVATLQTPQKAGYGLGWELPALTLHGKPTRAVGHHGDSLGGRVATLLTLPEHGITVAVTSNVSYADTAEIATRLAEAFSPP